MISVWQKFIFSVKNFFLWKLCRVSYHDTVFLKQKVEWSHFVGSLFTRTWNLISGVGFHKVSFWEESVCWKTKYVFTKFEAYFELCCSDHHVSIRFQVFTVVVAETVVFWPVAPCSVVGLFQFFFQEHTVSIFRVTEFGPGECQSSAPEPKFWSGPIILCALKTLKAFIGHCN